MIRAFTQFDWPRLRVASTAQNSDCIIPKAFANGNAMPRLAAIVSDFDEGRSAADLVHRPLRPDK
jgi:hypothetical protein